MQLSLFGFNTKLQKLSKLGDPLEFISQNFEFEELRAVLKKTFKDRYATSENNFKNAGRKSYDPVFVFKILFIKKMFNMSHQDTEFRINDSLSCQRFLNLDQEQLSPDFSTIWRYEEALVDTGLFDEIYTKVLQTIEQKGYIAQEGYMVDATFVEVPKQRNTREENQQLKQGEIPESFSSSPQRCSQKDTDAKWAMKNNQSHYGYKNHTLVDVFYKFVRSYVVTEANIHDSQMLKVLIKDQPIEELYADSAYCSKSIKQYLKRKSIQSFLSEKGHRNHPLSDEQKQSNKEKSKIRSRVEHVYGFMVQAMKGKNIRTIGMKRAHFQIGMSNLAYNICRLAHLQSLEAK